MSEVYCDWCGSKFVQDEECVEFEELLFHPDCFDKAAPKILIDRYGANETYFHVWDEWDEADFERKSLAEDMIG